MSRQFCRYVFLYDNFLALTQMEITYQKANAVVKEFLKRHPHKLNSLKENLAENAKIIQYIYATLFPKYYSRNNKFGMQNKSLVDLAYREWISNTAVEKNKEKLQLAKDPNNYSRSEKNISEFEQVPVKKKNRRLYKKLVYYLKKLRKKISKQIKLQNKWTIDKKENEKTWKTKKKILEKKT